MEGPPHSTTPPIPTTSATRPAVYPRSVDSSPRSRQNNSGDSDPPTSQAPAKLRLMCSYGGQIIPRPHDKTLCYVGGDTRIIVIDRRTTLSDLHNRLSRSLLRNQTFSLKYQLPNEDLDSLISITADEDLENMVEEYDRLHGSGGGGASKRGRIRLFLFPKSSLSMEQLIVETASIKSEEWFLNALNGKSSNISAAASDRGFSDSSSVNCLLGLDDDFVGKGAVIVEKDVEAQIDGSKVGGTGNGNRIGDHVTNQELHSVPDSPVLETASSFGSISSPPFLANLPPIRVRVEENQKVGVEEHLQQMSVGKVNFRPAAALRKEEVGVYLSGNIASGTMVSRMPVMVGDEYPNCVISDDERSDHVGGYGKVQQIQQQVQPQLHPQQIPQFLPKPISAFDLPSPDSASSEGSIANSFSRQKRAIYQEPVVEIQPANTRISSNPVAINTSDNTKIHMQPQVQESGYILSGQYDQNNHRLHNHPQAFVHPDNQYISNSALPIPSYYTIYPPQNPNQHHPILDQQYPVYFVPDRQIQTHSPAGVVPQTAYGQTGVQYVNFTQVHQPSYEFSDPNNYGNMFYKPLPPQMAAQYHTPTSAPGMVAPDAS